MKPDAAAMPSQHKCSSDCKHWTMLVYSIWFGKTAVPYCRKYNLPLNAAQGVCK